MGRSRRHENSLVRRLLRLVAVTVLAVVVVMLLPPVRNTLLLPVWPRIWRDVSSVDVLRMYSTIWKLTPLPLPEKIECSADAGKGRPSFQSGGHSASEADSDLAEYLRQLVHERQEGPQLLDVVPDLDDFFQLPADSIRKELLNLRQLRDEAYNKSLTQHRQWETWLSHSASRKARYHKFRPLLQPSEAAASVHLLFVFDLVCRASGIQYLMQAGSMLGAYRHRGLIPWDDDIDISIDVAQADLAFRVLSCIPGYALRVVHAASRAQWKLYRSTTSSDHQEPASSPRQQQQQQQRLDSPAHGGHQEPAAAGDGSSTKVGFPALDIFIHAHDHRFMWSLVVFTFTQDFTFRMEDVVPVQTWPFEGGRVAMVRKVGRVLGSMYDPELCLSPTYDHKKEVGLPASDVSAVRCAELREVYPLFN